MIFCFYKFQRGDIFVIFADLFCWNYKDGLMYFCIILPRLANFGKIRFINSMNFPYSIPIGLCIVCHGPLEVHISCTILNHQCIEILPKQCTCSIILWLRVTSHFCKEFIIFVIVHMTCYNHLVFQMFYMAKHDPQILHITSNIHTLYKFNSTAQNVHI